VERIAEAFIVVDDGDDASVMLADWIAWIVDHTRR
jgi:hypothetical protein